MIFNLNMKVKIVRTFGAIALSCVPPFVINDSSWKNVAESFTVALTLTLGEYESAIVPNFLVLCF